jgi:hypothetical protein
MMQQSLVFFWTMPQRGAYDSVPAMPVFAQI